MEDCVLVTYKVGISGSYGGLNLGDEAILQSIITQLRRSIDVEITVFTRNAQDTLMRHKVEKVVEVRTLTKVEVTPQIRHLDLFILGGGGIFFDKEVDIFLRELEIAHQNDVLSMVYAVGAGPLNNDNSRKKVKEVLNRVEVITVREREAKKIFEDCGVTNQILVTADPAFLLTPEPLPENALQFERVHSQRALVGISVRKPACSTRLDLTFAWRCLTADSCGRLKQTCIPMERACLMQHSQSFHDANRHAAVMKGDYSSGQYAIRNFEFTSACGYIS